MAKKIRKRKSASAASKKENKTMEFLKSERAHFIFGVIVAFFGIFILMAIISFFFTGASDQSKVLNKSFFELINDKTLGIENWTGAGGAKIAETIVNKWFGVFSMLIPLFIIYLGLRFMNVSKLPFFKTFVVTALSIIGGSIASAFVLGKMFPLSHINWGGTHGTQIESLLESSIGWPGVVMLILLFILIIIVLLRKNSIYTIQNTLAREKSNDENEVAQSSKGYDTLSAEQVKNESWIKRLFRRWRKKKIMNKDAEQDDDLSPSDTLDDEASAVTEEPPLKKMMDQQRSRETNEFEVIVPKDEEVVSSGHANPIVVLQDEPQNESSEETEQVEEYDPKKDLSSFEFPSINLLKMYDTSGKEVDMEEQNENKNKIISTLQHYGIEIKSIKATVGPTITLYEIVPQAGVRISRIRNLEDDIALSLSALGIRIIAPMPGKGTVGIEVPNKDPQIVSMQSVISSKKFQECAYELPVALGKTITNEVFIFDLAKMPHLLVAGATGQGKSVGLNAIITSLLYKKHPSEMKMVLVDPKMVEFNIYSTIERHYLAKLPDEEKAIITDVTKVTQTLNSLTKEMDDRYEMLMRAKVRSIKEYNEKFIKRKLNPANGHRYLPYIVVVIDEFGDLIMTAGKEIEMPIARIAQKARAVGMHMVIATQRPTTNIITGTIKANFPARMAFRVTSSIDSRTILDMNGANQLIGRGDMLFSQGSNLIRIQCAFVDTPEVEQIAQYIGQQNGYDSAFALPEVIAEGDDKISAVDMSERDVLFEEAARLIVVHQQGSTSLIQRKFSIGYNRAGRLMDQIEAAGIVGPAQGSKARDVYIADEYSLEKLLDSLR